MKKSKIDVKSLQVLASIKAIANVNLTVSLAVKLIVTLTVTAMLGATASAQQIYGVPNNNELNVNSFFCKCDDAGDDYNLVRVDISQGKRFETKVRAFPKKSFTLPQCEAFINTYSSCLK